MKSGRQVPRWRWSLLLCGLMAVWGFPSAGTGRAAADLPAGLSEVSPAQPMPTFRLPALNGTAMESAALQGKVVVVRFWATW
jgi:cytochrome oxidase Cu insertion factor (SCO1/SenC/PrrC family)